MGLLMAITNYGSPSVSQLGRWAEEVFRDVMNESFFNSIIKKGTPMENILNDISLINLHVSLWQGDKALKAEDLAANGIDVSKLPPGKLASLGCKRTIGKEATRGFIALKREAHTLCGKYGVKFGEAGYAIPDDKTEEVCMSLMDIKARFTKEKAEFLTVYEEQTEAWIAQNDYEWRDAIRSAIDPIDKVGSVLSFNFSAYKINPVVTENNGLEEEVCGLYGQLCHEIRQAAGVTMKTSYLGKTSVGRRALRPLQTIHGKLHAMKILEPTVGDLADEVVECYNNAGASIRNSSTSELAGPALTQVIGMLTKLSVMGLPVVEEETPETEADEVLLEDLVAVGAHFDSAVVAPATQVIDIPNWDF